MTRGTPLLELDNFSTHYVSAQGTRVVLADDQVIGPGETITGSAIFVVNRPGRDVLGWQITFTVGAPRWFGRQWWWVATTFVPAPPTRVLTKA